MKFFTPSAYTPPAFFKRESLVISLLSLITFSLFFQVSGYDFVAWDDNVNVYGNPGVSKPSLQNIIQFWKEPYLHMYIPMTYTVWTAIAFIAGTENPAGGESLNPQYFHLANLLLHTISACSLFFILRLTLSCLNESRDLSPQRVNMASLFGALLFSVHPLQVESVAWVTGMKDTLSGAFCLLAILQYLRWAKAYQSLPSGGSMLNLWGATLLYSLALLAKPTAVVVPLIAFIIHYFLMRPSSPRAFLPLAGWLFASFLFVWIAKSSQSYENTSLGIPLLWKRPLIFLDSTSFYLGKLLFPVGLTVDYGRKPAMVLSSLSSFFTCALPLLLLITALWVKLGRVWVAAVAISIAGILPVSGLLPFGFQFFSSVADRYFYISMMGPALALSFLLSLKNTRVATLSVTLLLITLALQTIFQTGTWKSSRTLFANTLLVNENSFAAHNNLANALIREGEIERAIVHFKEAVRINPGFYQAYSNLAGAYFMAGDTERAIESVRQVLNINPSLERARMNLAQVLLKEGRYGEARYHFLELLKVNSRSTAALFGLAESLMGMGRPMLALKEAEKILKLDTSSIRAYNFMASVMADQGRVEEAMKLLKTGVAENPRSEELTLSLDALNRLRS